MLKKFMMYEMLQRLPDRQGILGEMAGLPCRPPTSETTSGWADGQDVLSPVTQESLVGCQLHVQLVEGERKIPASILAAEVKKETRLRLKASGNAYLSRKEQAELRKEIQDRLLGTTNPTYTGIPVVEASDRWLMVGSNSDKQIDRTTAFLRDVLGFSPKVITPTYLTHKLLDIRDLPELRFGRQPEAGAGSGCDFFTYLLFLIMTGQRKNLLIEGPLTMIGEGSGAHQVVISKGCPFGADEFRSALHEGKRLKSAQLHVVDGDEVTSAKFDAELMAWTSVKYPLAENMDQTSRDQQRVGQAERMAQTVYQEFENYAGLINKNRNKVSKEVASWAENY